MALCPGSLGNLGVKLTTADVRIDWRVVDVYNRRVVKTGSATASQKGGGFDVGTAVNGHGGRIGFDNQEFMNSALGKATVKAVTVISQDMAGLNLPASGRTQSKMQVAQAQQAASTAASTPSVDPRHSPGGREQEHPDRFRWLQAGL